MNGDESVDLTGLIQALNNVNSEISEIKKGVKKDTKIFIRDTAQLLYSYNNFDQENAKAPYHAAIDAINRANILADVLKKNGLLED